MVNAMAAMQSGEMGVNKASLEYGVPAKTTLKDRIAGRVAYTCKKPGPESYLTSDEEKEHCQKWPMEQWTSTYLYCTSPCICS